MRSVPALLLALTFAACTVQPDPCLGATQPYLRVDVRVAQDADQDDLNRLARQVRRRLGDTTINAPEAGNPAGWVIRVDRGSVDESRADAVVDALVASDLVDSVTTTECAGR